MPDDRPLITIVIAARNAADTLPRCLRSVREQSLADFEVVVIDGDSDDATVDTIRANEDWLAHWVSEPDSGIYDAWNKGVEAARGDWVAFLGADDRLAGPDVLARLADAARAAPEETELVYGRVEYVDEGSVVGGKGTPWRSPWRWPDRYFRASLPVAHPAALHRRAGFREHGLFDASYRIAGDTEYLLRILRHGNAVFVPDLVTVQMSLGGVSNHPAQARRLVEEVRRLRLQHDLPPGLGWHWLRLRCALKTLALRPGSPFAVLLWIKRRI